ncbi:STAS domain-containing protein [Paraglaciecola sp. MB-3u-78]|jgi:anti-sigma B factor antagonist|uniref:STAS domain-containing protein n=1 Tax=Paraglaciecola sp. MB-3u-78 TaxID=2058332 RepID=UPI0012FEB7EA|nr:STAS domain-containing protein [Paraglaciecola sp. MB-3u-78]
METKKEQGVFVISPIGRLDTNTSPDAERLIVEAIDSGEKNVVMDYTSTEYISSAGLRVVLKTAKLLKPKGGVIVVCNGNEQITEVFEISGFSGMVASFNSLEEAVSSLN